MSEEEPFYLVTYDVEVREGVQTFRDLNMLVTKDGVPMPEDTEVEWMSGMDFGHQVKINGEVVKYAEVRFNGVLQARAGFDPVARAVFDEESRHWSIDLPDLSDFMPERIQPDRRFPW